MKDQTREVVYRILVILLLWGAFWIASLGNISMLSLVLGILIAVIGILLVGLPGAHPPVIHVYPRDVAGESTASLRGQEVHPPFPEELESLRQGRMPVGEGGWVRFPLPNGGYGRQPPAPKTALASGTAADGEWNLGAKLSKFETTWELAMREFDPGPRDILLSSRSQTRIDRELLPGLGDQPEKFSSLGVTGDMPDDILILREVVETRAAPDRRVYQRTIQALMHRDGMCEYRALGKEPSKDRFEDEKGFFASA